MNVSSLAAFFYIPYKSLYSASKSFIKNFSRALVGELNGKGVSISVLFPNGVKTNQITTTRIDAHGKVGHWTQGNVNEVVLSAIEGMLKGKFYIIPGYANHFLLLLRLIIPIPIQQWLISREFEKEAKATCAHVQSD